MPIQVLEVRFESDNPEWAVQDLIETIAADGLEVRYIRTEE